MPRSAPSSSRTSTAASGSGVPGAGRGPGRGADRSGARAGRARDRSRARAWIVQILYAWEAGGRALPLPAALEATLAARVVAPRRRPYIRRLIAVLAAHLDQIDGVLQDSLENWRLERLSSLDRQILRLGAAEMLYLDDIPQRVSIQEAIRLAEQYGGEESARFVNGVLDAVLRRIEAGR